MKVDKVNIFNIYKTATENAEKLILWQDKLKVWQIVIDYCLNEKNYNRENKRIRDKILYWTWNNIGDIWITRDTDKAIECYSNALPYAFEKDEKVGIYRRIAYLYKQSGDISGWLDITKEIVGKEDMLEIKSYIEQARHITEATEKKKYLQKAWAKAESASNRESLVFSAVSVNKEASSLEKMRDKKQKVELFDKRI